MAKTITLNVLENTLTADIQQESEHNATVLTVDFTGCGVDGAVKWIDFVMSDGTQASISLGTSIIPTYNLPNTLTKGGILELQAYAKNGTTITHKSKVFRITIKRSLDVTTNTSDYDISVVEALQDAISDALIQVETIWEAYNTGELDGEDGLDGVSVNSIALVGNDLVFTMSDLTVRTLVGAKLDLQGEKGDKGDKGVAGINGKTIVSASFVGNDLVFVNNDSSTVTLLNAKLSLKGDQGIQGISGISAYQVALNNGFVGTESEWLLSLKGYKGDTGSIEDLGGVIAGLTEKTTPVNNDKFVISDSADTNHEKRLSWSNIKATLKTYFDTLYNNYVHPANHPASIITQDSLNRFVTDDEKVTWSGKANSSHTHTIGNVSGLQTALDGKLSSVPNDNTQLASLGVGTAPSGTAGEIRATNNITAYYSDARLKTFLGKIPDALDKIKSLNGYIFVENEKAKELGYSNDRVQVGVSAQEVQSVLPEAVTEAPIGQGYLTVWYEKLVPLLIEGVKEQQAQIDALKQEVRRLRGD